MRSSFLVLAVLAAACGAGKESEATTTTEAQLESVDVSLEDVAILFPLREGLWPASRVVPQRVVEALGPLVQGQPNGETYASLRVVALRLEPCFLARPGDACERQIRFVLQPVVNDTTLDAAVHVLWSLPTDAFGELARGLRALRMSPAATSLGVHPALAAEGLAGPFAQSLYRLIGATLSRGRLVRATFLGLRGRGNEWQLGGVVVDASGSTSPLPIPTSGAKVQSIVLERGATTFVKSISPQTAGPDDVSLLFDSLGAASASTEDIGAALHAANRIENPTLRSSEDTDCATCHAIESSRLWAEKTFGRRDDRERYPSTSDGAPSADLGVLRALGYFGSVPVVSTRARNDTANAVAILRAGSTGTP